MTDEPGQDSTTDPERDEAPAKESAAAAGRLRAAVKRGLAAVADWFWANVVVVAFGVWLVGQVWRDGSRWTARCFVVPSLVVAGALLATALLARLCTCRKIALAALVLSVPPLVTTLAVENRWWQPATPGDPERRLRLVHWNTGGRDDGIEALIDALKPLEADACLLSEIYAAETAQRIASALGPEFTFVQRHNLALLARGRTRAVLSDERIRRRAYFVEWESPHGVLTVLMADAPTTYYHARLLRDIRQRMVEHAVDLAAGDFNASRRSRALALPEGYAHAYDAAGCGWSATWPTEWPLTLWDIDQCMLGPRVQPIRYRLRSAPISDHRLGILDFSVAAP